MKIECLQNFITTVVLIPALSVLLQEAGSVRVTFTEHAYRHGVDNRINALCSVYKEAGPVMCSV